MEHHSVFEDPNLTLGLALLIGLIGQAAAVHLKVPGIVLLLALGVLVGPDVLGLIHPEVLGEGLTSLVGFAVAVILFEGGMNLSIPGIQRAGRPIQRLITVGALITLVGATIAARAFLQWSWSLSFLFGTLVVVTGPTVVTPLLKRLKVRKEVATILEAEGVLIDPIGAIMAVVALEVVIAPSVAEVAFGIPDMILRLGSGALEGVAGGAALSWVLRKRGLIPEGLTNVFVLAFVFALFNLSNAAYHESGIASVTMAGITVRYFGTPVERELLEFKEQLTVMLIGMLFVLLAADVRIELVQSLGWQGILVVAALLPIRVVNVVISTLGTGLDWRAKAFMAWVAPRGIVAAAVASLFAVELDRAGLEGGPELRALVFLVIAVSVVATGLTGGAVAWLLGIRRPSNAGWVILGAHALARHLALALQAGDEDVLLIDVNPDNCRHAEEAGIRVIHGNAMKESVLLRAELDTRAGAVGLTRNEEVNFLFAQKVRQHARSARLFVALSDDQGGVTREMVHDAHAHLLFGTDHDVERWAARIDHGTARVVHCVVVDTPEGAPRKAGDVHCDGKALPLVVMRNGALSPVGEHITFRKRDEVVFVIDTNFEDVVFQLLKDRGFAPKGRTQDEEEEVSEEAS